MIPSEETMRALVGHRFPGGTYRIEHWENFLLSEATGVEPLPERLAHPAHLFHVAINGVGTSISELFRLAVPFDMPSFLLNDLTGRAFYELYIRIQRAGRRSPGRWVGASNGESHRPGRSRWTSSTTSTPTSSSAIAAA